MKKIPVYTSILLIAGVVATMAFSQPLVVENGVVRGYSQNSTLTIDYHGQYDTFMLPQGVTVLPQNATNGLGAGARVTVFGQCFHGGAKSAATTANNGNPDNDHICVALGVLVRVPASGAVPATGGTANGTATATPSTGAGTTTPGAATATPAVGTETPAVIGTETPIGGTSLPSTGGTAMATETPAAGAGGNTTGIGTAPGCICPTATSTATPGTGATMTPTPTLAAGIGTETATATPFCTCTPAATSTP